MIRACPAHDLEFDDELVCDYCVYPRTSWLVVDDKGRTIAAGRVHRYRDKRDDCVWLIDEIDPRTILLELARQVDQDPRQERELAEMPWGDQE